MRKSHLRKALAREQSSTLTPLGTSAENLNLVSGRGLGSQTSKALETADGSIRFSTCAQSTPKRAKLTITTDDEDPFADDDDDDMVENHQEKKNIVDNTNKISKETHVTNTIDDFQPSRPEGVENMCEILEKCKFYLESSVTGEHLLKLDKSIFIRDLGKELKKGNKDTEFLNAFKQYHLDNKKLQISFSSTWVITDLPSDSENEQGSMQDCFIRLMLQVGVIQSRLILYLVERITNVILLDKENDEGIVWVRNLLSSLTYLDVIYDSKSLCDHLFDLLGMVNSPVIKREIIMSLPDILSFDVHSTVAIKLSTILQEDESLMPVVLETLSILTLTSDTLRTVQETTIKALKSASLDALPAIIKFLITCNDSSYDEVINGIRSELTFEKRPMSLSQMPMSSQSDAEKKKLMTLIQKKLFLYIRDEMSLNKKFFDAWLKSIKKVPTDDTDDETPSHNPMDIIILIIMYNSVQNELHKESVLKVFRALIINNTINEDILKRTIQSFITLLKDETYFMPFMKIITSFMRSNERLIIKFNNDVLCELIKYIDGRWIRWILTDIVSIIGCGDNASVQNALKILNKICIEFRTKIKPMSKFLMILLNKLDDFSVYDVRQLLNVLCFLSYDDDVDTLINDEINILIQKKLSSIDLHSLRIGVIGATMMIKHVAMVPQGENNTLQSECSHETAQHTSTNTFSITERGNKARELMNSVSEKLKNKGNDVLGLFYDQLNFILFKDEHIDVTFKIKVTECTKEKLKDIFFTNNYHTDQFLEPDSLKCSVQFSLSEKEQLSINITSLLLKEKSTQKGSVLLLPGLMRLLRVADYLHNIDTLINLGLILPHRTSYEVNGFTMLSAPQQEVVISSLFVAINWFRELLNCFANLIKSDADDVSNKVVIRLQNIILLQTQLSQCLPLLSSDTYIPPICYFHVNVKNPISSDKNKSVKSKDPKAKSSNKRKRSEPDSSTCADTTVSVPDDTVVDNDIVEDDKPNIPQTDLALYRSYFRELETDVWLIFKKDFTLIPAAEKDGKFSGELGPLELLFLLNDCVNKLERCLPPTVKKISSLKTVTSSEKTLGFEHLDSSSDIDVLHKYMKVLQFLCFDMEKICAYLHRTLAAFDKIYDAQSLFVPETRPIKLCLMQLFKSMSIVFSWNGFQIYNGDSQVPNLRYLKYGLNVFVKRGSPDTEAASSPDLKCLVEGSFNYLFNLHDCISYLPAAVSYLKLLQTISKFTPSLKHLKMKICDIAWEFLTRRWYNLIGVEEKGALYCNDIEYLLMTHFDSPDGSLNNLDKIFAPLVEDIDQLTDKDSCLNTVATIGKSNLHILIRCLCKGLENAIKTKVNSDSTKDILESWLRAFKYMEVLVVVLRDKEQHKQKTNLIAFLKQSIEIFKLFLKQGIVLCKENFRSDNTLVCQIFKKLQASTRYIQNICNHSKKTEDLQLSKYLPTAKQMMENIILQVKHIMAIHDLSSAIQVANLKMRDVAGKEIEIDSSGESSDEDNNIQSDSGVNKNSSDNENDNDGSDAESNHSDINGKSNSNNSDLDNADDADGCEDVSDTSSLV